MISQSAVTAESLVRRSGNLMADVTPMDFTKEIGAIHGSSLMTPIDYSEPRQEDFMNGDQHGVSKGEILTTNLPQLYEVHVESVEGSPKFFKHSALKDEVGPGDKRGKGVVPVCDISGTNTFTPYQFQALKHVEFHAQSATKGNLETIPTFGLPTHPVKVGAAQTMQAEHENVISPDDARANSKGWKKRVLVGSKASPQTVQANPIAGKRKAQGGGVSNRDVNGKKYCMGTEQERGCNQNLAEAGAQPRQSI